MQDIDPPVPPHPDIDRDATRLRTANVHTTRATLRSLARANSVTRVLFCAPHRNDRRQRSFRLASTRVAPGRATRADDPGHHRRTF
jgi:hypothetical protein